MDNLSPEQIKAMIMMLQNMLPQDAPTSTDESVHTEEINDQNSVIKTKKSRNLNQGNRINRFDEMMESKLHKADVLIDKKLQQFDPTPRTRAFQPLKVKCRVCGKTEEINPVLLSDTADRYKCNKCSRSAG